jgi:acyl-CoA synthetase (AMP-forming)/AMP-acid ligase II
MILSQAFNQAAMKSASHPAMVDNNKNITYGDLKARIGRLSNLYQAEVPQGGRAAIFASNGAPFAQTLFALSNTGNPIYIVDPAENDDIILNDFRQLQVQAVMVTGNYLSRVNDLIKRMGGGLMVVEIEKRHAGEYDPAFQPLPDRPIKDSDVVLVLPQEDTGNDRKYCAFKHTQIIATCNSIKRFYQLRPTDRMLTTMHWSHPFALTHGLLMPLFNGATAIADPQSVSVEEFMSFLTDHRPTRFAGPPKFYYQLLSYCASQKYMLPGVKSITVGMGSLSLALRKICKLLKIPVLRCYGRREGIWSLAMDNVEEALDIENTKSRPAVGVKMQVLNEDGEEIPGPGPREGRLMAMTEAVASGYFHPDPKIASKGNADRFRGTWLKTGDIARLDGEDDEVTVAVLGKRDDMLFSNGTYLSARKIDEVARSIDGIEDAAGFVRMGKDEPAFSVVVKLAGKKMNEKELLKRIQDGLPPEYHPQTIFITDSIPKDAFDSVVRMALQRQFSAV